MTQAFVQDQFEIGRVTSRLALGGVDHETFGSELTWNAEFGAAFGTGTRVTLSGGTAFRAPDSTDRFGFGGNPDLDPEVSRQVEIIGAPEVRRAPPAVAVRVRQPHRRSHRVRGHRLRHVRRPEPERRARAHQGRGARATTSPAKAWRARAELTLQDPRDETTDERLLRRSRESLMVAVNRDVGALDVGVDIAAFGDRKDFGFPDNVTLDSYTLVNATLRYRVNDALTLQGRLENLFDEDYTLAEGYRTEGRSYTVGVRYSFE